MNFHQSFEKCSIVHTCQHLKVRKQNTRYCEGAKRPSPREGSSRGGEGVPPPTVGSFCIFGLQIVQSGAYLERKFRLKIYCIAWKATNLKIQKTERSVFLGFKNFKNRTVLLKTEQLASLIVLSSRTDFFVNMSGQISSRCRQLSTKQWSGNKCNDVPTKIQTLSYTMDQRDWPGKQWRAKHPLDSALFANSQAF